MAQWVDVTDFGAANDGSADASPAVNAALASFAGGSGGIYFPEGSYRLNHAVLLHSGVALRGAGSANTHLNFEHDTIGIGCIGDGAGAFVAATGGYTKNSEWITVSDASSFDANGWYRSR